MDRIMTQENKDLLLKDLCARFAYGLKVSEYFQTTKIWTRPKDYMDVGPYYILKHPERTKPFLRPMSSMTEEEEKELMVLTNNKFSLRFDKSKIINIPISKIDGEWHCGSLTSSVDSFDIISLIDWLNAHHFDYRGLIEKGLAIEAPEGMYEIAQTVCNSQKQTDTENLKNE